jgi:AcrR family transcriptional regulator
LRKKRRTTAKDEQREATRARLLAVARELFARHGYHDVAITEISRAAGLTHGVIHAHFHSKAGLLFAILSENNEAQEAAARSVVASEGPIEARLRKVIDIYVADDLEDRELLSVMQSFSWQWPYDFEEKNRRQLAGVLAPLRQLVLEAVAAGELRESLDVDRTVATAFAIYTQALRDAVFDETSETECADEIMARLRLLIDGLRKPGAAGRSA